MDDIVSFMLYEQGEKKGKNKLDVGPNYYAGRLLSEGYHMYYRNVTNDPQHWWFKVDPALAHTVVQQANSILDTFTLIGIYEWPHATRCVTQLMLHAFDTAQQIERVTFNDNGVKNSNSAARLFAQLMGENKFNTGQYHVVRNASSVWQYGFSVQQRRVFEEHEWIDLDIYEHAVEGFIEQVYEVGCERELERDMDDMQRGTGTGDGDFDGLLNGAVKRFRRRVDDGGTKSE